VPVVCSTAGGLPETLLPGVTGLLVPASDSAALASTVLELVSNQDLREEMGAAGTSWARSRFGFDTIARAFETLLRGTSEPATSLASTAACQSRFSP
jgi:glycosyltransferase involved in cell wall biosynthesis